MAKRKSIPIGQHFESLIRIQIETTSTSEVDRAKLSSFEEEEEDKRRLLIRALIEGEESGWVENFNPIDFKTGLKKGILLNE